MMPGPGRGWGVDGVGMGRGGTGRNAQGWRWPATDGLVALQGPTVEAGKIDRNILKLAVVVDGNR